MDFSKFDKSVNAEEMAKALEEAKNNPQFESKELPAGEYLVRLEKMELGATKDGRPMFKVMMRVLEGEYKKWCMFMNRVIYGTKNDANMINSVLGWLDTLEPETLVDFKNYSQFSETVQDIYEELVDAVELKVAYDPDQFNSIDVLELYDVDNPF